MPNLPALPTGQALLDESEGERAYGSHCKTVRAENGVGLYALDSLSGNALVWIGNEDDPAINLKAVDTETVPYVNAFLKDHGIKVEKYWRTGEYRIKEGKANTRVTSFTTVATTQPYVAPMPVGSTPTAADLLAFPSPIPYTTAQTVDTFDPNAPIPGVETLPALKPKKVKGGYVALGDIVVPQRDLDTLNDAWTIRQAGVPASVLITGPAGTAKTALVRAFAASLGVDFLKVDGGAIRTADDWSGAMRQDPITRTWQHRWSPFARVLKRGTPMVILIDEFNRTESPQALNNLLGLLDWTGTLLVPDANDVLRMPPGVLIVCTANIGPEFVGTLPLDGAVRQRFAHGVRLNYPEPKTEADILIDMTNIPTDEAERLVMLADSQRASREDPQQYPSGAVISTRVILDIARRISVCGTNPRDAVLSTLSAQFDPGDEAALSVLVDSQYPIMVEVEDDSPIEITPEMIERWAEEEKAKNNSTIAQQLQASNSVTCTGTSRYNTTCGYVYEVRLTECPSCSTPNPVTAAIAAAAAAAPRPLITVAKHFFVNRGLNGQLTTECQYRFEPKDPNSRICGKDRRSPIHHD